MKNIALSPSVFRQPVPVPDVKIQQEALPLIIRVADEFRILIPSHAFVPAIEASAKNFYKHYLQVKEKDLAPEKNWFKINVIGGVIGLATWSLGFTFAGGVLLSASAMSSWFAWLNPASKQQTHDIQLKFLDYVIENLIQDAQNLSISQLQEIPCSRQLAPDLPMIRTTKTFVTLTEQHLRDLLFNDKPSSPIWPLPLWLANAPTWTLWQGETIRGEILRSAFPSLFSRSSSNAG